MLRKRLAANVFAYRKFHKMSQANLAKISGINLTQIGNIENSRISTGIDLQERLAAAFKIDPCLLLARSSILMPGTGIKRTSILPTFFTEGVAAYAFWTSEGMEFHPISNDSVRNTLHMMALLQANGITGKDLLAESEKLHIPYKKLLEG